VAPVTARRSWRCRRNRWATIPATLPLMPEPWRVWALTALKAVAERQPPERAEPQDFGLTDADVWVSKERSGPPLSILAVARREAGGLTADG
jgi:hypothetical protein